MTVLNSALVGTVGFLEATLNKTQTKVILKMLNRLITKEGGKYEDGLFNTVGVNDLLFGGYTPGIL